MPQRNKILLRQIFSSKLEERVYAKMILYQGGNFRYSQCIVLIEFIKSGISLYLNDEITVKLHFV